MRPLSITAAFICIAKFSHAAADGLRHSEAVTNSPPRRLESGNCPEVCIDFSHYDNNIRLNHGDYVSDEWLEEFGMTVVGDSPNDGYTQDGKIRIFDTSLYDTLDADLGSPNQRCPGGGPGVGSGGVPGSPGANCVPQGNVLIIQEPDKEETDDNAYGGTFTFTFGHPGKHVSRIGFIDLEIDQGTYLFLLPSTGGPPRTIYVDGLGDNSIQDELIDQANVTRIAVYATGSCGISKICFCVDNDENVLPEITSFTLIDAETKEDLSLVDDGGSLDLAGLPDIAIRADTTGAVGNVQLFVDNESVGVQSAFPYVFTLELTRAGPLRLTAELYEDTDGRGAALSSLSVWCTVLDAEDSSSSPSEQHSVAPSVSLSSWPSAASALPTSLPTVSISRMPSWAPVGLQTTPAGPASLITGFVLINADTNMTMGNLDQGAVLALAGLPSIDIRAGTTGEIGSVQFLVDGILIRVENASPYTIGGDSKCDYHTWEPKAGPQTLTAIAYEKSQAKGNALSTLSVSFTVHGADSAVPSPPNDSMSEDLSLPPSAAPLSPSVLPSFSPFLVPMNAPSLSPSTGPSSVPSVAPEPRGGIVSGSVTGFTLVNADTDNDISRVVNGQTIDMNKFPNINIRVETSGSVGSAVFLVDGVVIGVQSSKPYTLGGDSNGDFYPWKPTQTGPQTLTAILFEEEGAGGALLTGVPVFFTLIGPTLPSSHPSGSQSIEPSVRPSLSPVADLSIAPTLTSSSAPSLAPSGTTTTMHPISPSVTGSSAPVRAVSTSPSEVPPTHSPQTRPTPSPEEEEQLDCRYKKITWEDFEGAPRTGADQDSGLSSSIQYNKYITNAPERQSDGTWLVEMKQIAGSAYMDKTLSFVVPGKQTKELLEHEQCRFDISQYWARELDTALRAVQGRGATPEEANTNSHTEVARVYIEVFLEMVKMAGDYDRETEQSRNLARQKEWCAKINRLLNPPAPTTLTSESSPTTVWKNTDGGLVVGDAILVAFSDNSSPIGDSHIYGLELKVPELTYGGLAVDDPSKPLFYPSDPRDAQIAVFNASDMSTPVLTGQLRVLAGDGGSLRGWIEMFEVSPSTTARSPYLELVTSVLQKGGGILTLEIKMKDPKTPDYANPFIASATVRLGVAVDAVRAEETYFPSSAPSLIPSVVPSFHSTSPTVLGSSVPSSSSLAVPLDDGMDRKTPYMQLTWDEFKGPSPTADDKDAGLVAGLQVSSYSIAAPRFVRDVYIVRMRQVRASSFMKKMQSGVKPEKKTDDLLGHLQGHFDITEYWARKLETSLRRLTGTGTTQAEAFDSFQRDVSEIYHFIQVSGRRMRSNYETETDNGRIATKQEEWRTEIDRLLDRTRGRKPGRSREGSV